MNRWDKYYKSKRGFIRTKYHTQVKSSSDRAHDPPDYTADELEEWALSQEIFHTLFDAWVASGYSSPLSPSFNRTDDSKGYDLKRLEIVTWQENRNNSPAQFERVAVVGTELRTGKIVLFPSTREAGRAIEADQSNISKCCRGKQKSAGGYVWRYTGS